MRHVVVMVTSSYPRFPGDSVGTFMEPIATTVAAQGHEVHVVAPWHPLIQRSPEEQGVRFHFYKYAPVSALNVFGYAEAMRADVKLRGASLMAAPLALAQAWRMANRVARTHRATVMHGHWVVPGGITAALARPGLPLVISLHGSDVFVAEKLAPARLAARAAFWRAGAITACSEDLARRAVALGANAGRVEVVPYGVDVHRFKPDARQRRTLRSAMGFQEEDLMIFAAGRLVRKKGFEHLIDAMAAVPVHVRAGLAIAGGGDLEPELRQRAQAVGGNRINLLGSVTQDEVAAYLAAADIVVVPSVRDEAGNVDGLPNVVMEALASGTPLITTTAGGIGAVVSHDETAFVVPEKDPAAISAGIVALATDPVRRARLGAAARALMEERFGWIRTAERIENAYDRALALKSSGR
jgi:glycosyltransferase involved in cell wall biosynthesis